MNFKKSYFPKIFSILLLFWVCVIAQNIYSQDIKLVNGKWFDRQNFKEKTVWISDGKLSFKPKKTKSEKTIDLSGKFVIPPFAEAHNHNLESEYELDKRINEYLANGVFYVKLQSSIKKRIQPLMNKYNHPKGLDISQAFAPLTGTDGHPIGIRKMYLERGYFDGLFKTLDEVETHGYFTINDEKDLEDKWKTVLSFKPDFIKTMLVFSEEYEKRKDDKSFFGNKGLNPKLLPKIVKKAHTEGLRVSVHVKTPTDFETAVLSGADEIAHLPGYSNGLRISKKQAELAAQKDVTVITTISPAKRRSKQSNYKEIFESIKFNLKTLKDAGVKIAIGSDIYNDTSLSEVKFLKELDVFTNLELLKMWSENSAKTIFPKRKIGKLKNGFEASFLVLEGNPIEDFENFQKIEMRVKQGQILE